MSSPTFYVFVLSFFAGVFTFSFVEFTPGAGLVLILGIAVAFYISLDQRSVFATLLFGAVASFLLGGLRMHSSRDTPVQDISGRAVLEGYVCDEPRRKETTQSFCFAPYGRDGKVLVTTGIYPRYEYGESLRIEGEIRPPENFTTYEGGPEFDYISYLSKDGIFFTMFRPKIVLEGVKRGSMLVASLFTVKNAFIKQMQDLFPEPEASLLGGLLLGDRSALPKDVTEEFKVTGLVHILVLSGYNVTIVAESLMKMFAFLPRTFGQSAGALSIILFALMTGASATTVRASIMALIVILARSSSRRYDIVRALLVAAFLMVMHNPSILAFDISFQLSFLATLSLVCVSPLVSDKLLWVTERWNLREILSSTIATQVFVFPYLVYTMGQISLISLATNMLVLPFVPYTMLFGFLSVLSGFVTNLVAVPMSWLSSASLTYILSVASIFSKVPFASIHIKTSIVGLVCIYAIYAGFLTFAWRRRNCSRPSTN